MAADTFSKALCTSLAQLRAVYAEAERAGISLGDTSVRAGLSLPSYSSVMSLYVHNRLRAHTRA